MGRLDLFLASVADTPWAILPSRGRAILSVLARRAAGRPTSRHERSKVRADRGAYAARRDGASRAAGQGIAVLPIYGVLVHRAHQVDNASGGGTVAYESIAQAFRAANADPNVGTILLDVDSPGGSVYGCEELGALIASSEKPVVAVANACAASAAYWLASQADELIVTPSGSVGSIGVYVVHEDISKMLEAEGVTPTEVFAGAHKVEGTPYAPLSDEARATMQATVDRYYAAFTKAVASGRGVAPSVARGERFGEGRMFGAKEAVERGMADRVATLDETIARLMGGGRVKRRAVAMAIERDGEVLAVIREDEIDDAVRAGLGPMTRTQDGVSVELDTTALSALAERAMRDARVAEPEKPVASEPKPDNASTPDDADLAALDLDLA